MSKSIDDDITLTLTKLHTLLEYSTSPNADIVCCLIEKAKTTWEGDLEEEQKNVVD